MLANLAVALAVTALQVVVLSAPPCCAARTARARRAAPPGSSAPPCCSAVGMYGVAETLANRIPTVEEYTGALPGVAIVPFFFAGSLFPITALPWALTGVRQGAAPHPRPGPDALRPARPQRDRPARHLGHVERQRRRPALSLRCVAAFAALLTAVAIRTFNRAAVR